MTLDVEELGAAAREALEQGRIDEAEALLREALAQDPAADPLRINLAACLGLQGRLQEAVTELRSVLDRNPAYLFPRALLATLLAREGRWDQAHAEVDRCLAETRRERPSSEAADQLVAALALLDRDEDLLALHPLLEPMTPSLGPETLHALALAARRAGREGGAFEEALERHPAAGYEPIASGLAALRQGRVRDRVHLQRLAVADELRQEADRLARTGRLPEAETRYLRVLELLPGAVGTRINLSNLYRSVGRLAEAQRLLEEAAERQPHPGVLLNLAGVLTERGRLAESHELLDRLDPSALDEPLQMLFHLVRAEAWSRAGDHGQALAAWEEAARLDPEAEEVRRTRAELDRRRQESELLGFLKLYQDRRRERLERALVRREPGRLPSVQEGLRVLTTDNLRAVWSHYREDPFPRARSEAAAALARTVVDRLPHTLEALSGAEKDVVQTLASAGGFMELEELTRSHPSYGHDSWFWDRMLPESSLARLRFLQVVGFGRFEAGSSPVAYLPQEVAALLG